MKSLRKILACMAVLSVIVFMGCNNSADSPSSGNSKIDQALVGTWIVQGDLPAGSPGKLIFKANGTGEFTFGEESINVTWAATNNELTIIGDGEQIVSSYSISGNTVTITSGSTSTSYTKQQ